MALFCKHNWIIKQSITTPSKMEHWIKVTGSKEGHPIPRNNFQYNESTDRKQITIIACDKCGKLKRYVEVI